MTTMTFTTGQDGPVLTPAPAVIVAPAEPTAVPAAVAPLDPAPVVVAVAAPAPVAPPAPVSQVGKVISYDDYDYVTETTTVRHGIIIDQGQVVIADGSTADTFTVGFLSHTVTLPVDAFATV